MKLGPKLSLIPLVALTSSLSHAATKEQSPQWHEGKFVNPEPIRNNYWEMLNAFRKASPHTRPTDSLPLIHPNPKLFQTAPASGLRVTWLGHSTMILEIDGQRILIDPVWADRASPVQWAGPKRWYEPLLDLAQLPALDAILISHDHYDHLDESVIKVIAQRRHTRFIVPIGLAPTLQEWGIPHARITELDWWDSTYIGDVKVTATPARHASGRGLFDRDKSLWNGYALLSPSHRVYYSGDTGPSKAAAEIGKRLGPFDFTMIECGQYNDAWPDWHMTPEQSLETHKAVRGRTMMPVHWGLFKLAFHSWKDPVERLNQANTDSNTLILVPKPGESIEPTMVKSQEEWWQSLK